MKEMKRDMETLKKKGFNFIKLQENWGVDEPREGCCDFGKYMELIEYAQKLDMGVYLGLTCEQAPNWLWEKHPGCRMVGRNGQPIAYQAQATMTGDGKPGPCYDHAGAMTEQLKFIEKLVRVLGQYENLVVWNTWQEIGYRSEDIVQQHACYCDSTLEYFREWLKGKYGDLDRLNQKWNTRYSDWRYVQPDRSGVKICLPNDIEWKYFMDHVQIERVLKSRAEAVRRADPLKRPVFAHKCFPIVGSGADWTYARAQDFLGSSCYPAWGSGQDWDDWKRGGAVSRRDALQTEMWSGAAMTFDYIRSCNVRGNPVWAAEFQGGPVSTGFQYGRVPDAEDMRRWMLTAIGSGVTAVSFWVARAEIMAAEMNGFALLDSEGDSTERFEEAARVGAALNRHAGLFASQTCPAAEAAILINEGNYLHCMSIAQGGENLPYSVRGWYKLLWDAGIPVDFLEAAELDEPYATDYKVLILPFPLSVSEEVAEKLAAYVGRGGNLISEAAPGRLNDYGYANRGELSPTLRALFGVRQTMFRMVREPGGEARWSPPERTWGEYLEAAVLDGTGSMAGKRLRANLYIETFECGEGAEPVLKYGNETAGVVSGHGEGKAWLLGTYVGHNGTAYRNQETREFVLELLRAGGVLPAHPGRLLLRRRVSGRKQAWIFTNPEEEPVTEYIDTAGWPEVEDLLGEALEVKDGRTALTVQGLDVRVLIVSEADR
jgi:beta-galactosidase